MKRLQLVWTVDNLFLIFYIFEKKSVSYSKIVWDNIL